jgi:hypothetical protein
MIRLTSRDTISSLDEILSGLDKVQTSKAQEVHIAPVQRINQPLGNPLVNKEQVMPLQPKNIVGQMSNKPIDIVRVKNAWPILITTMAVKKMSISSYLSKGMPLSVRNNVISVMFPKELTLHMEVLEDVRNKSSIESTLSQIMDTSLKLQFIPADTDIKINDPKKENEPKEPIINSALNIFGGKIVRVKDK